MAFELPPEPRQLFLGGAEGILGPNGSGFRGGLLAGLLPDLVISEERRRRSMVAQRYSSCPEPD